MVAFDIGNVPVLVEQMTRNRAVSLMSGPARALWGKLPPKPEQISKAGIWA